MPFNPLRKDPIGLRNGLWAIEPKCGILRDSEFCFLFSVFRLQGEENRSQNSESGEREVGEMILIEGDNNAF
jgi:hypothetical protein